MPCSTVLHTVVTVLHIICPLLIYFISGSLCILTPLTYFAHYFPLPSGNHNSVLCIYDFCLVFCFSVVSCVQLFATPWTAAHQSPLSFTISQSLLKFMSIELVMLSNQHILCHSHLLLPSIFTSIRVFFSQSVLCIRWLKYWSFSFSISPSNEYSGLISFRINSLDLLAFQGTLKSSPVPQLKNISSLVLSLLYGPSLTSIHDFWKNHSFD